MTSKKVGRPPVEGSPVSFRIWEEFFPIVELGATIQARLISRSHPMRRMPSPNNVLWVRSLIQFAAANRARINETDQKAGMLESLNMEKNMVKISLILPLEHKIWLRQFECFTQALDWSLDFNRNAAINLMVMQHGDKLNQSMGEEPGEP